MFGILTSKVINEFLTKKADSNNFYYDFSDENDEFLLINDLFNFKSIKITYENIELINKIVNDLQIECIMDQISKFFDDFDSFNFALDEQQELADSIDKLFDWLYHIDKITVEKVKYLIAESKWIKNEENIKELIAFIIQVINSEIRLHPFLLELIIKLNEEVNENLKENILYSFIANKLMVSFGFSICNCSFVYLLLKSGKIEKKEIFDKVEFYLKLNKTNKNKFNSKLHVLFFQESLLSD